MLGQLGGAFCRCTVDFRAAQRVLPDSGRKRGFAIAAELIRLEDIENLSTLALHIHKCMQNKHLRLMGRARVLPEI